MLLGSRGDVVIALADGSVGWAAQRPDDCQRAAIATCLQVPIWEVPDPHLDERLARGRESVGTISRRTWEELDAWLAARGLRRRMHRPPEDLDRWVGIVPGGAGAFQGHALVMVGDQVLFDPASPHAARLRMLVFNRAHVACGLSFEKRKWC